MSLESTKTDILISSCWTDSFSALLVALPVYHRLVTGIGFQYSDWLMQTLLSPAGREGRPVWGEYVPQV